MNCNCTGPSVPLRKSTSLLVVVLRDPENLIFPCTCNFSVGFVIPIPTFNEVVQEPCVTFDHCNVASSIKVAYVGIGLYNSSSSVEVIGIVNILKSDIYRLPTFVILPSLFVYDADVNATSLNNCLVPLFIRTNPCVKELLVIFHNK